MLLGAQGALSKWTPLPSQIKMGFRVELHSFKGPGVPESFRAVRTWCLTEKPPYSQKDSDLKARPLQLDSLGFKSQVCHHHIDSLEKLSDKKYKMLSTA